MFNCSDWEFKRIKENQNMFIDFKEYPEVVVRGFNRLNNSQQDSKFLGVFTVFTEKEGIYCFILYRKTGYNKKGIIQG